MDEMSTVEMQIAKRSLDHPGQALTNLHSYIDLNMLIASFGLLNRSGASGVDKQTWADYCEGFEGRLKGLHEAFKSGKYRAPNIRRVYIPKGEGKELRPLGIPTVEDKLLQTAVSRTLVPVYEQMFYDSSYGYRPGKSCHQAIARLFEGVSFKGMRYVIDADIKNYFGTIDHQHLRGFMDLRIKDGVIRKQIDKWLKAGILENGQVEYPKAGTPQGGSISPLLSNIYLHYVLDEWFVEQIKPLLKGQSMLIRYADDFLICFSHMEDAARVMKVLPKRLSKYGLTLHPDKSKLVDLTNRSGSKPGTFDFLGFTHYMSRSRKGYSILKRKTSSNKLRISLKGMYQWLRSHIHQPLRLIIKKINQKLKGYYAYYAITFNIRRVKAYFEQVKRMFHKWLNRRGGKPKWNWERFNQLINHWMPLAVPRIYHKYQLAKP